MPNIMLFGFPQKEANELTLRINRIMQGLGLGDEAVVTNINCTVTSCDDQMTASPYIRICDTGVEEINRIILAFMEAELRVDCEILLLHSFFLKEDMHIVD